MEPQPSVNLVDLEDGILAKVLGYLSSPAEVLKMTICAKSIKTRLEQPFMGNALFHRYFHGPETITGSGLGFGAVDPFSEFKSLSKRLWPLWSQKYIKVTSGAQTASFPRSKISLKSEKLYQIQNPLQPLPLGCGRIKYEEFTVNSIIQTGDHPSLVIGFALPGMQGQNLAKTKFSCGIDLFALAAFEGIDIPIPLSHPIKLAPGYKIGIGMCFECHSDELQLDCFFATLNGNLIYESRCMGAVHRGFYLTSIYPSQVSIELSTNRGDQPFAFDVKGFQIQHATQHDFFRSYLSVTHHLHNVDGQLPFWTAQRITENIILAADYAPVAEILKTCQDFDFIHKIAVYQLQIYRWQKLYGVLVQHQIDNPDLNSLPPIAADQASLDAILSRLNFTSVVVDFNQPLPQVWKDLLIGITELRYLTQVSILTEAIAHYKSRNTSIFDDSQEIRGGSFEGWIKQAMFLHTTIDVNDNDWVQLIRDSALEDLIESEFNVPAACPGYTDDFTDGIDDMADAEVNGDINEPEQPIQSEVFEDFDDTKETEPLNPEEERKATKMITIAFVMRAWAAWMGVFSGNLEDEISALMGISARSVHSPIAKDTTLNLVSLAILKQSSEETTKKLPSPIWVLMQYMSLGFGPQEDMNEIPQSFAAAVEGLTRYFTQQCRDLSEDDLESDLQSLLTSDTIDEDLMYLSHQYQLAMMTRVTGKQLGNTILDVSPPDVIGRMNLPTQPLPALDAQVLPPKTRPDPPQPPSTQSENQPAKPTSNNLWMMLGATGVVSACIGALIAILVAKRLR